MRSRYSSDSIRARCTNIRSTRRHPLPAGTGATRGATICRVALETAEGAAGVSDELLDRFAERQRPDVRHSHARQQ